MRVPTIALALVLGAGLAHADGIPLSIEVGKTVDLAIISIQSICDDPSVVSVEATKSAIRVTGLKEGKTTCSFSQAPGVRRVYQIAVVPPKPAK